MIKLHWLLATRTIEEAKDDSWRSPFVLNDLLDAIDVEDMFASKFDAGFRTEAAHPANSAIRVFIGIFKEVVWIVRVLCAGLCHAFSVQAGEALFFSKETAARVSTGMNLVAILS